MNNSKLLTELITSIMFMRKTDMQEVKSLYAMLRDNKIPSQKDKTLKMLKAQHKCVFLPQAEGDYSSDLFADYEENSVVIIPIIGMMTKYGSWYSYGIDEIANVIRAVDMSPNICGSILLCNTPGGSNQSLLQIEDAMRNRTKPCVGVIDGNCFSAGIYALSFCNKIVATNLMCEVGSIGAMSFLVDDSEYWENLGIKELEFYPPESEFKNLDIREALKGNAEMLIKEQLSPIAIHFQNIIKENRPKIDLKVPGIIGGKTFYAKDAVNSKLIDDIMNIDSAVQLVQTLSQNQKNIYSQLKI